MAPIHHHFEQKGWSEATIVIRFDDNYSTSYGKSFNFKQDNLEKKPYSKNILILEWGVQKNQLPNFLNIKNLIFSFGMTMRKN